MKIPFNTYLISLIVISCFVRCSTSIHVNKKAEAFSLSDAFENQFLVGAAISEDQILGKDKKSISIVKNEYNTITPENSLKWMFIEPQPNKFNFDVSDKYVDFGMKNNMHIVGHALVWHSQLSDYMKEIKDRKTMSFHIQNHINTLVKRYKGKIHTWDVVNEALNEDGTLRESVFFNIMGSEYIENSFSWANDADPDVN